MKADEVAGSQAAEQVRAQSDRPRAGTPRGAPRRGADDASRPLSARKQAKPSQATILVGLADAAGVELFRTPAGESFATVVVDDVRQTLRVRSVSFNRWLRRLYHDATGGRAVSAVGVADAIATLEGHAMFGPEESSVHVRLAGCDDGIYLDLGRPDWSVVEVTSGGWRVMDDPVVRFHRTKGLAALPVPVAGGDLAELWRFLPVAEADRPLVAGWLSFAFSPTGPYPVLSLLGEQGSGKSTAARVLRSLVDPNAAPIRAEPREARDLMIAATNAWVVAFDNLSAVPSWLSDALCRLATGGGFAARKLYSDDEEAIFDAQRPVILNGIADLATRSDLLDRSLLVTLPRLADDQRQTEAEFWRAFEEARPRLLGCLLDAASMALRRCDSVPLSSAPRMADFAIWVMAAAPALGIDADEFLRAVRSNRAGAYEVALEASPIVPFLRDLVAGRGPAPWTLTANELLDKLNVQRGDRRPPQGWPTKAHTLRSDLRRIAPDLRATGIDVQLPDVKMRTAHGVQRVVVLCAVQRGGETGNSGNNAVAQAGAEDEGRPQVHDPTG